MKNFNDYYSLGLKCSCGWEKFRAIKNLLRNIHEHWLHGLLVIVH